MAPRIRPSESPGRLILADTSAWVELDRATGSRVHLRIRELIRSQSELAVTEPVIMEVLVGARDRKREEDLNRLLRGFELLPFESGDFEGAVRIYSRCRHSGFTPRGLIDCMIAAVAWRFGASILAHDVELTRIATTVGIPLDGASFEIR